MLTASVFRDNRPEFGDVNAYPDRVVTRLIALAYRLLDPLRWRDLIDDGAEAFVCHHLAMFRRAVLESDDGDAPGEVRGVVTSEGVDKLSASYDSGSVTLADAGPWNATTYGQEYWLLASSLAIGGFQL